MEGAEYNRRTRERAWQKRQKDASRHATPCNAGRAGVAAPIQNYPVQLTIILDSSESPPGFSACSHTMPFLGFRFAHPRL